MPPSRRDFLSLAGASALIPVAARLDRGGGSGEPPCRIRTFTAGVPATNFVDLRPFESALGVLGRVKRRFEGEGYEVQTIRIGCVANLGAVPARLRDTMLDALVEFDALLTSHGAIAGLGPLLDGDLVEPELAPWTAELFRRTTRLSGMVPVATPQLGAMPNAAETAARIMVAIAASTPDGLGNFRFAAAANVPPGTPFFPVAYHTGKISLAVGLEGAGLVREGLTGATSPAAAVAALRERLESAFQPVARMAQAMAQAEGWQYLGIDGSPTPGMDRSIGGALEAFLQAPFGSSGTLEACGIVTAALKSLTVRTCGYNGLMLPVLEDPVLAQRASEGRFGIPDLLSYSSVCGTGLDLVPIPGDTSVAAITPVIRDVAALAARWGKSLSARLLLVPGKQAGEMVSFSNPMLMACKVMRVP